MYATTKIAFWRFYSTRAYRQLDVHAKWDKNKASTQAINQPRYSERGRPSLNYGRMRSED